MYIVGLQNIVTYVSNSDCFFFNFMEILLTLKSTYSVFLNPIWVLNIDFIYFVLQYTFLLLYIIM